MTSLKRYSLIWIVLLLALIVPAVPGFSQDPFGRPIPCPPLCPDTPPEDPIWNTAIVQYEWPDGTWRSARYDPATLLIDHNVNGTIREIISTEPATAGTVLIWNFVTGDWDPYVYVPDMGGQQTLPPGGFDDLSPEGKVRFEIDLLYDLSGQLLQEIADPDTAKKKPYGMGAQVWISTLEKLEASNTSTTFSRNRFDYPNLASYFVDVLNDLFNRVQILEATAGPINETDLIIKLSTAKGTIQGLLRTFGDIINDSSFGLNVLTAPFEVLDFMILYENPELNLPPGFGIVQALEQNKAALQQRHQRVRALRNSFHDLINQMYDYSNAGDSSEGQLDPCFPFFWYWVFGGDNFVASLRDLALEASAQVVKPADFDPNYLLRYADYQLGGLNEQTGLLAYEMLSLVNDTIFEVNWAAGQCSEIYFPIPEVVPNEFYGMSSDIIGE